MKVFHKIPVFFEGWLPLTYISSVQYSSCTSLPEYPTETYWTPIDKCLDEQFLITFFCLDKCCSIDTVTVALEHLQLRVFYSKVPDPHRGTNNFKGYRLFGQLLYFHCNSWTCSHQSIQSKVLPPIDEAPHVQTLNVVLSGNKSKTS